MKTALALTAALLVSAPPSAPPPPGLATDCRVTEVYDGDTVVVKFEATARVRLLDCWAPEVRTKDAAEKVKGVASRDHLARALGMEWDGKRWRGSAPARLHVPFDASHDVGDVTTMGRVLGSLWFDGQDLSALQVTSGHATPAKGER